MGVLVIGGNGQLGSACVAELRRRGTDVRATVRDTARAGPLTSYGVETVTLDLLDGPGARRRVLEGTECVVLTANGVAPRAGDRPDELDRAMDELVDDAEQVGVRRLVLPSVPVTPVDGAVPFARSRRRLEDRLLGSGLEAWVVRLPPFMESWLALVGSSLPLRGEPLATIGRPSPFLQRYRAATGRMVEERGIMLVPGPAAHRHAFIAVRDAARACAEAALRPEVPEGPVEVAGPELLTWDEVAQAFSRALGRPVRVVTTPAVVFSAAARVLAPVASVPARTMALNRYLAASETAWTDAGGGLVDPASMTTVDEFLRAKAALPAELPHVA